MVERPMLFRLARLLGAAGAVVITLAAVLTGSVNAVAAQSDDAEPERIATVDLAVIGEVGGDQPTNQIDATVTVRAERAISARLLVLDEPVRGPATTWEFALDLAAGTEATVPVTLVGGWDGVRAQATLEASGAIIAEDSLQQFPTGPGGGAIVGTLGVTEVPRQIIELGTNDRLPVFAVDDNPGAVARTSTIITEPAVVRDIANSPIGDTLDAWLRGGGQLIIDGPVASLDDRYNAQPTASPNTFLVGAGSVRYDTAWRDGVPIGGRTGSSALQRLIDEQGFGSGAAGELALLADLGLPRAGVMAGVLLGYAVIAGPLLYVLVGRRGLHRRLWTLLPGLAVLVAAAILIVGLLNGRGRTDAHITIVEVDATGSTATTNLLVGSRFGGSRELSVEPGWRYLGQNIGGSQRAVRLRPDAAGLRIAVDLPPSGNGNLRLAGPAPSYDGLIRIQSIEPLPDGSIAAELVNDSGADLQGVVALLGNDRDVIGDVAAGQTVSFTVDRADRSGRFMRELNVWPRVRSDWTENGPIAAPQDLDGDDPIEAGAWTQWRIDQGTSAVPDHVIGVVGWADGLASPIGGVERGHTALFTRATVPATVLGDQWVATSYQPVNQSNEPFIRNQFFGWPQHYRFALGPEADIADLAVHVGPEASGLAVLIDGSWIHAQLPDDDARTGVTIALPDNAAVDGAVVMRALIPEWEWNAPQTVFVAAAEAPAASPVETVEWTAEPTLRNGGGPFFEERFPPFGPEVFIVEAELLDPMPLGGEFATSGSLGPNEAWAYVVPLEPEQTLTATMRSATGDSYLEVWVNGEVVVSNDDFGENVDSRVVFDSIGGEIAEVRAQGLGGAPIDYDITIEIAS